jgi:hypothetical protein
MNVLGAGDAFAAGLMAGFLRGKDFARPPGWPMPAVPWWCPATPARRPCPRPPSWPTGSVASATRVSMPTPNWPICTAPPPPDRNGRSCRCWPSTTAASSWTWPNAAGASESRITVLKKLMLVAHSSRSCRRRGCRAAGVLIDGGAYGADALASATGRGWWVGGRSSCRARARCVSTAPCRSAAPGHLARRAGGEVPGALPPGRRGRPAAGTGAKGARSCGRPPAPAAMSCCWRSSARPASPPRCAPDDRRAARHPAFLQPGHPPGVVETGAHAARGLAGAGADWSASATRIAAAP